MATLKNIPVAAFAGIKVDKNKSQLVIFAGERLSQERKIQTSKLASFLRNLANKKKLKIVAATLTGKEIDKLGASLWLLNDIVPLTIGNGSRKNIKKLALFAASQFKNNTAKINLGPDNKVLVGDLVTLADYQKITPEADFKLLIKLAEKFGNKRIVYFSTTPRGGGVALMRHSLMRLYKLLGVSASWHVMQESPEVFEITKKKFHNILHNISPSSVRLTDIDKEIYLSWIKLNAKKLHSLFHKTDVIVIDDPQPSGLVPYIKKASPETKLIYRSHIHLETNLFLNKNSPQAVTWDFIWENIKEIDVFVSHPIRKFVPEVVDKQKVVFMPAALDPLDGLNKPLTEKQSNYYLDLFDRYLLESGQVPIDKKRPFIIQVARFDPSKGIPDVVKSYQKLRQLLFQQKSSLCPQLIITGQGSIDDPEGISILQKTLELVQDEKYQRIAKDIKIVRAPAVDQIQNALMRKAKIYLQLSHKEGFEDKISAALMMGIPVIIYNVGGMPLQVVAGKSGFIVEKGDTDQVAQYMYDLLINKNLYQKMSRAVKKYARPDVTTISNAINWLYLGNKLVKEGKIKGEMQMVYYLARS